MNRDEGKNNNTRVCNKNGGGGGGRENGNREIHPGIFTRVVKI